MSEISVQTREGPKLIPQKLPDKPGPKLVSAKGKVERLVVVLADDGKLNAETKRVLEDGNVPAVMVTGGMMIWTGHGYVGFDFASDTELGIYAGTFNAQGDLEIKEFRAAIAEHQIK